MAGYQNLNEFERGVIVGTREMGHCIYEVTMKFGYSRATILRVYREYRESSKTSNLRHRCGQKKIIKVDVDLTEAIFVRQRSTSYVQYFSMRCSKGAEYHSMSSVGDSATDLL
ncbi:HTH_Tnp_Tc3_2 domain-containing protein [Trichonephila clavipes]|uniref:HTH_Tnp_Tc3_2 domain-containing protein n=1 Tax=Trichonephila clavipes TaxID=2585209 RepID=A0A8X6WE06_TRICX|nr:HTH_Tnp_Tc3_2 domain-containing protein [Trichonephila clavipes]